MLKRKMGILSVVLALCAGPLHTRADVAPAETPAPAPAEVQTTPPAEEKEWSVTVGFDLWSEYIFRGVDLSGNDVMLNPSLSLSWKGFTAYYWGAYNDADSGGNKWYEEADLGVEYSHSFLDEKLTLTGGYLYYWYPDGKSGADTHELYGKATVNVLLSPYVALYYDIDEIRGGYLSFGVSHSFDIGSKLGLPEGQSLSIDPSAQLSLDLGYNSSASDSDVQFNDLLLGIKVPWQITKTLGIHAGIQFSVAMDSLNDIGQGNETIGNVGVSLSF